MPVPLPNDPVILLGSRSPRRRTLLSLLVPENRILVQQPAEEREQGFENLCQLPEILARLALIAREKTRSLAAPRDTDNRPILLTADTVVIAGSAGPLHVLGKPDGPDWQTTVRRWFHDYFFGQTHRVATAVCLTLPDAAREEFTVVTQVRFREADADLLEWYIATGEPLGKAGGYGLQDAGGMFVESVQGSLSNVIGLPLEETRKRLMRLQAAAPPRPTAGVSPPLDPPASSPTGR